MTAKFEEIMTLEQVLRLEIVSDQFSPIGLPAQVSADRQSNRQRTQAKLYAAISALSAEELKAYGEYRKEATK